MKTISVKLSTETKEEQATRAIERQKAGKFIISSCNGLVTAMTEYAKIMILADMDLHVMASIVMLILFGFTLRINEVTGWADYTPSYKDFDFDEWLCMFLAGSR